MSSPNESRDVRATLDWLRAVIEALHPMPRLNPRQSKETSGQRLARLRRARGLSQRDLAKLTGVSNRMIAYYETHADDFPAHTLPKFAQALTVSTDQLLGLKSTRALPSPPALDTRILRRLRLFERLPPADRRYILRQIELLARQAGVDHAA